MAEYILNRLADWAHGLTFKAIPPCLHELLKLQILNNLAAAAYGRATPTGDRLAAGLKLLNWQGQAPLLFHTRKTASPEAAALYHASLSEAHDFDDYLLMGHTGHSAVFTPLALAQGTSASLGDILTAQVIANETAGRLGASMVLGPQNGQMWTSIHLLGASLAAGRMLKLDAAHMAQAAALAFYQPPFALWPGFMGPESKIFSAGLPTALGIMSAKWAAAGLSGPLNILDDPQGFYAQFSFYPLTQFFSGLGKTWVTDTLSFKIYPGCAYLDSALDAVVELKTKYEAARKKKLTPAGIKFLSVKCSFLSYYMEHLSRIEFAAEPSPIQINFSLKWSLALSLLAGRLTPGELTPEYLNTVYAQAKNLVAHIELFHDADLSLAVIKYLDKHIDAIRLLRRIPLPELLPLVLKAWLCYGQAGAMLEEWRTLAHKIPDILERLVPGLTLFLAEGLASRGSYDFGKYSLKGIGVPIPVKLTLITQDGWKGEAAREFPLGSPPRPQEETRRLVEEKFLNSAVKASDKNRYRKFMERLFSAGPETPWAELMKLLQP